MQKVFSRCSVIGLVLVFLTSFSQSVLAKCPSKALLEKGIEKTFRQKIKVIKVEPSKMPGVCQVQVKFRGMTRLIYSDTKGDFLLAGQLFDTKTGKSLTKETLAEINRLTPKELQKLKGLSAFSLGNKGPVIYLVTDPHCPYCKKAEEILESLVKEGRVQVRYLLFPLKFHKGAKEECISIICDKKGLEGFKNRYRSENQCEKGKKQIDETVKFLMSKGISGTPTYIFPDGRYHSGVLNKKQLMEKLSKFK